MDNDEQLLGCTNKPRRDWLGFQDKALWDWMALLIVPLFIAGATGALGFLQFWIESQRADAQQQIEDDRVRQAVLQAYIQDMTELMLDKGLATSKQDQPIRSIARSNTLTAVRQLDGNRKGILLQFLYESNLIKGIDPIINLSGANLRDANMSSDIIQDTFVSRFGANLSNANLSGVNLGFANLELVSLLGANLSFADLSNANLNSATLSHADLSYADLGFADLTVADLEGADLRSTFLGSANLIFANLRDADLEGADLDGADLHDANLSSTNLRGAFLGSVVQEQTQERINEQLAQAASLLGATLPDGTVIRTKEDEEAFKERYRQ